uniref:Uncharacterized protein n=1 Tax=Vannella robusta TaxID=1487602 RepID=A0A7S4MCW4_9EUKA|mmetsp:Transcript_18359/g.23250  ORF Transcript_18359/g.23250 Transcript_18359/m.23250 type:complete len:328 (+) Transcript_18359:44-1027(+)
MKLVAAICFLVFASVASCRPVGDRYSYPPLGGGALWGVSATRAGTAITLDVPEQRENRFFNVFDFLFNTAVSGRNLIVSSFEKTGTRLDGVADSPTDPEYSLEYYFSVQSATARYILTVENKGTEAPDDGGGDVEVRDASPPVSIDFGASSSSSSMTIEMTSSGDTTFGADDNWLIVSQLDDPENPDTSTTTYVTLFFGHESSHSFTSASFVTEESFAGLSWAVQTPMLEEKVPVSYMFFATMSPSLQEAIDAVSVYESGSVTPELLSGLTPSDLDSIQNFVLLEASPNIPIPFSHSNLCKISSEVRDRVSETRGNQKHQFKQPWFC